MEISIIYTKSNNEQSQERIEMDDITFLYSRIFVLYKHESLLYWIYCFIEKLWIIEIGINKYLNNPLCPFDLSAEFKFTVLRFYS